VYTFEAGAGGHKLGYLDTVVQTDCSSYILADILNIHANIYCNCLNIFVAMSVRMENKYFNYDLVIFIRTWKNKKDRRPCFFAVVEKGTSPRHLPRSAV
jgi:hypothetical protein